MRRVAGLQQVGVAWTRGVQQRAGDVELSLVVGALKTLVLCRDPVSYFKTCRSPGRPAFCDIEQRDQLIRPAEREPLRCRSRRGSRTKELGAHCCRNARCNLPSCLPPRPDAPSFLPWLLLGRQKISTFPSSRPPSAQISCSLPLLLSAASFRDATNLMLEPLSEEKSTAAQRALL